MADRYPVIFTFREMVYGNGYVAGVTVRGRAIMEHDEGDWWCYGVEPGALAASGDTPLEAHVAFRTALVSVLFDLASEATGFDDFKRAAVGLFAQKDSVDANHWREAVEAVRSGEVTPPPFFKGLPKLAADTELFMLVELTSEIHSVTAGANVLPTESMAQPELQKVA